VIIDWYMKTPDARENQKVSSLFQFRLLLRAGFPERRRRGFALFVQERPRFLSRASDLSVSVARDLSGRHNHPKGGDE
jgi:hypothetical protein